MKAIRMELKTASSLALSALLLMVAPACFTNTLNQDAITQDITDGGTDSDLTGGSGSGGTTSAAHFEIASVNVVESGDGGGGTGSGTATLFLDSSKSTGKLFDYCNVSDQANASPCVCRWEWSEINEQSGSAVKIPRIAETAISTVQDYLTVCAIPPVYTSEISDGTLIRISVASTAGTTGVFTMDPYGFIKEQSVAPDFRDEVGRGFVNIHRYTCYEKYTRGMAIRTKTTDLTQNATGRIEKVPLATDFCFKRNSSGSGGSSSDCASTGGSSYSAQANYYNLYRKSPLLGSALVSHNNRFTCPLVKESLYSNGSASSDGSPWPLDATFALAQSAGDEFSVGVEGPSVLGLAGDANTAPGTCFPPTDGDGGGGAAAGDPNSISPQCLGFALRPNTDGSCPSFTDDKGQLRFTYRLRRYVAFYPPIFDTNGEVISQPQVVDTVFVLDRPVKSGNPLKPYTMKGPLPCNFAYFDHAGVLGWDRTANSNQGGISSAFQPGTYGTTVGGRPAYKGTNNPLWAEKSVDGLFLPNVDAITSSGPSCSAMLPIVHFDSVTKAPIRLTLGTTHASNTGRYDVGGKEIWFNKVWIRPTDPWWPHYVEDTDFQACAPQADPFRDPPLHFAKGDDGTVRWCAEAYPTQNDNVPSIDRIKDAGPSDYELGFVKPFTSHVVKNSYSASCSYTPVTVSSEYDAANNDSCDGPNGWTMPELQSDPASEVSFPKGSPPAFFAAARHPASMIVDWRKDLPGSGECAPGTCVCSDRTCDRTVVNNVPGEWPRFPLLAEPQDVEAMLKADDSFACQVTWDDDNGKQGRTTPTEGCCAPGAVKMRTGPNDGATNVGTAHLEPDIRCQAPNY